MKSSERDVIIVDTNAWIYLFDKREKDANVQKSRKFFEENTKTLFTTDLIIEETHKWLVHKGRPLQLANLVLENLIREKFAQIIPIEPEDREKVLGVVKKYADLKLSYTDAFSVVIMQRMKIKEIFSFDSHFDLFPLIQRVP